MIQLPLTAKEALDAIILPSLKEMPEIFFSQKAACLLLAIGLQESGFRTRNQCGGPALGFWQFEKEGVAAVVTSVNVNKYLYPICLSHEVPINPYAIYERLPEDDTLAAIIARLYLYLDPAPLPNVGHENLAWNYYLRNWRPGKPSRGRWVNSYGEAMKEFT